MKVLKTEEIFIFQARIIKFGGYDGGLLVRGMYPTSFFLSNTLKINGFATNQEKPRTNSPLL